MSKKKNKDDTVYKTGCVMYVDGGCRSGYHDPNMKYGGWGFHGYTYDIGKIPKTLRTKKDVPTIKGYQIGSDYPLQEHVTVTGYIDGWGSLDNKETNNSAELSGFKRALEQIKSMDIKKAHFLLDSEYVLKGITEYYPRWEANNWYNSSGKPVQNKTLWIDVANTYNDIKSNIDFSMAWVNGHSGNLGNDRADVLATTAVFMGRNGDVNKEKIVLSPIAKYRQPEVNINRIFQKHRWYFNTHPEPAMSRDGRYVYNCGSHGPDDTLVGKRTHDSTACVIYTKEQQHVLETVRQQHIKLIPNDLDDLCMMHLDTVLLPRVYQSIIEDGPNVLSIATRKSGYKGLCTAEDKQVTKVCDPPGLTFRLIEVHNFLQNQLDDFIDGKQVTTDITDQFYMKTSVKKKKVEEEISVCLLQPGQRTIKLDVNVGHQQKGYFIYPVKMTIGLDTPSREMINALGPRNPKVSAVTWMVGDKAFRYAIVIEADEDIIFWMGKDSSLQFVWDHAKIVKEGKVIDL